MKPYRQQGPSCSVAAVCMAAALPEPAYREWESVFNHIVDIQGVYRAVADWEEACGFPKRTFIDLRLSHAAIDPKIDEGILCVSLWSCGRHTCHALYYRDGVVYDSMDGSIWEWWRYAVCNDAYVHVEVGLTPTSVGATIRVGERQCT